LEKSLESKYFELELILWQIYQNGISKTNEFPYLIYQKLSYVLL